MMAGPGGRGKRVAANVLAFPTCAAVSGTWHDSAPKGTLAVTDLIAATSPAANGRPRGWLALRIATAATAATTAGAAARYCLLWRMLSMFHDEAGMPDPSALESALRLWLLCRWPVMALTAASIGAGVVAAWRSRGRYRAVAVMLAVAGAIMVAHLVADMVHWQPAMWVFSLMGLKGA